MSLLQQIQESIVEEGADLGSILLKLRLLSARLGSDILEEWVSMSLRDTRGMRKSHLIVLLALPIEVPLGITRGQLSSAMGVSRRTVNELCTGKRSITVDIALMLAKVSGNTANFWLNLQQRNDIWAALHSSKRMEKIERVSPIREIRGKYHCESVMEWGKDEV